MEGIRASTEQKTSSVKKLPLQHIN